MHTGGPVERVPAVEARQTDSGYGWLPQAHPLRPKPEDFEFAGQSLLKLCREYLDVARSLVEKERELANEVHGGESLTPSMPFAVTLLVNSGQSFAYL
jgi:hypothetical protein